MTKWQLQRPRLGQFALSSRSAVASRALLSAEKEPDHGIAFCQTNQAGTALCCRSLRRSSIDIIRSRLRCCATRPLANRLPPTSWSGSSATRSISIAVVDQFPLCASRIRATRLAPNCPDRAEAQHPRDGISSGRETFRFSADQANVNESRLAIALADFFPVRTLKNAR
jgi:hypothetical protein